MKFTFLYSKHFVSLFQQTENPLKTKTDFFQLNYLETQLTQLNPPFILIKPS